VQSKTVSRPASTVHRDGFDCSIEIEQGREFSKVSPDFSLQNTYPKKHHLAIVILFYALYPFVGMNGNRHNGASSLLTTDKSRLLLIRSFFSRRAASFQLVSVHFDFVFVSFPRSNGHHFVRYICSRVQSFSCSVVENLSVCSFIVSASTGLRIYGRTLYS